MKFYNREPELERLHTFKGLAEQALFFIRVTGGRRIGKTLLIREYLKQTRGQSQQPTQNTWVPAGRDF